MAGHVSQPGQGAGGGGGSSSMDVQHFTTAGAHVWNKPTGAKFVRVVCIGAGGGGGGMGELTLGCKSGQPPGGSGGGISSALFLASDLPNSVAITVPAGGAGGLAKTGGGSGPGGPGSDGLPAIFGDELQAFGGLGATSTGPMAGGVGLDSDGGAGSGLTSDVCGVAPWPPEPVPAIGFAPAGGATGGAQAVTTPVSDAEMANGSDGGTVSLFPGSVLAVSTGGTSHFNAAGTDAIPNGAGTLGVPGNGGGGGGTTFLTNERGGGGAAGQSPGGGGGGSGAKGLGTDPASPPDGGAGGAGYVGVFTML